MTMLSKLMAVAQTRGGALALVAALQIGALSWMVVDRMMLLKSGRELQMTIIPVDPRDLFKGDYVRLGYGASTVNGKLFEGVRLRSDGTIFVTIEPTEDGKWSPKSVSGDYPASVPNDHAVLKGHIEQRTRQTLLEGRTTSPIRVTYGLERYYVAEGKGRDLEKLVRDKKLAAIVAVDRRGQAAIKGLAVDGQKIYDEPLL